MSLSKLPENSDPESVHDPDVETQLSEILEKVSRLYPKLVDMSLVRVERFLHQLSDPHLNLPPVIHIAGTNGKGSTGATLRALLESDGYKVHVMTSPHLVRINERYRIAGNPIGSSYLVTLLEECIGKNGGQPITTFEFLTAAGFLAFAREPADFTILETGMGGRLDATNVVPDPAATIITTLSFDHKDFLGQTLTAIAREKAGIMKRGIPCIVGWQTHEAQRSGVPETLLSHALSTGSQLHRYGSEWICEPELDQMRFRAGSDSLLLRRPNLLGLHQIYNAGAAIAALRVMGKLSGSSQKVSTALGQIEWPGRLQRLTWGRLAALLPAGWEIWIDGGHNDSAGEVLAMQAAEWGKQDDRPLHIIMGMVSRKDPKAFFDPIRPYANSLTLIPIPDEDQSFTTSDIRTRLGVTGLEIHEKGDTYTAIQAVLKDFPASRGRILITGSLYLMGSILKDL